LHRRQTAQRPVAPCLLDITADTAVWRRRRRRRLDLPFRENARRPQTHAQTTFAGAPSI